MKTTKNNFWRLILLGLALAGSLASAAFGMNQDEATAPNLAKQTFVTPAAEQVVTLISSDGKKHPVSLDMLAKLFRGSTALSQVLYNLCNEPLVDQVPEIPVNIDSNTLKKVIAIFTHLYEAKKYGQNNIENEANYIQMIDRESVDIFTGLATQDKRKLLFDLHTAADYLDSQALYDLCERQFISPEITQDLIAHPQEYTNQWLLAVRRMPVTVGTGRFNMTQTLQGHNNYVDSVALSPDGNTIVSGSGDDTIKVWTKDPATHLFAESQTLQGHNRPVCSVALSTDGNTIVSGSRDNTVKVWQRDYFSGTASIPQAMLLKAIKEQLLDLRETTEANKILREIAAGFSGTPAKNYVRKHVLMDWAQVTAPEAQPQPTVRSRLTHFVRQHPIATIAAVGSAVGIGYATRTLWRKLF